MRFSLVTPTLGREKELERLLDSLLEQSFDDFEIILVDQNPDGRLDPLVSRYRDVLHLHHLRSPRRGASRARNTGLARCRGEIVAFPDDDCWYPRDLLERVDRFFTRHPEVDALCTRLVDGRGASCILDFDTEPGPIDRINVWRRSIESTMFLRRESTRRLWFDESLGTGSGTPWGSGEGTDYLLQLMDRGASLYYDPEIVVMHDPPVPPFDERAMRRAYTYGCGMGRVLKKHKYPAGAKLRLLGVPLGQALRSAAGAKGGAARYHLRVFGGRARGLMM